MRVFSGKPLACVLGDMDLIRPLGLAGIPCAVVTKAGSATRYSRFTQLAFRWERDFWDDWDQLVEALIRFGSEQSERPVLFYQQDSQLLLVSRNRERLGQVFRFVMPDATLVEDLLDKGRFQALAEREGLPVPRAIRIDPVADQSYVDTGLDFPVVVKPATRCTPWEAIGGSAKAIQVDTSERLRKMWPRLVSANLELLIQEAVPGPETCIESYHVYVDQCDEVVAEFTGRKIRTIPKSCGFSTSLTISESDDVAELGRSLVRKLRLQGVAKIDFKRGVDGKLHLLEINPRFNLWHHLGAVAGVNLPALAYADLVGLPRPSTGGARVGTSWCRMLGDLRAAKASGVSVITWLRWAIRCEAKLLNWDDPMPALVPLVHRAGAMWHRRKPVKPGDLSIRAEPGAPV